MSIFILGEAWGEHEAREGRPFAGAAGYELTRMLGEAGIDRRACYLSNVFNIRPPGNKVEWFCGPKAEAIDGYPMLTKSKYVRAEFARELRRLQGELLAQGPNVVIALGNTAMWALLGKTAITKFRGSTATSTHTVTGLKVLPTFHPAAVLRQWELRPTTVMDLIKARKQSDYPEVRRPEVMIHVPETPEEIVHFQKEFINGSETLAVDIETSGQQITCIGFAPSKTHALVVPIHDYRRKGGSYWETGELETLAWAAVRSILIAQRPRKIFQNGLYDIAFLWRSYRIGVKGVAEDTMLLHHALQPESLKGLGFLGSVYTDHGPWKQERQKSWTIKKDE
jgi:DNA polymerase